MNKYYQVTLNNSVRRLFTLIVFLPCHSACHINLYKRSFALRNLFDDAY